MALESAAQRAAIEMKTSLGGNMLEAPPELNPFLDLFCCRPSLQGGVSLASRVKKCEKPALPDRGCIEVQCLGQKASLPAADQGCLKVHAECVQFRLPCHLPMLTHSPQATSSRPCTRDTEHHIAQGSSSFLQQQNTKAFLSTLCA
eukprot:1161723-Pelagomonas_calceolata.AAC.2